MSKYWSEHQRQATTNFDQAAPQQSAFGRVIWREVAVSRRPGGPRGVARRRVIIEPNSPSAGVTVAFIAVNGAPVELMQIDHDLRPDL